MLKILRHSLFLSFSCLAFLLFFFLHGPVHANLVTLEDIYARLLHDFPQYEGVTYGKPSVENYLIKNDWLYQTPNIWNVSLNEYNESFNVRRPNKMDDDFYVPTCEVQSDCSGKALCRTAPFTLDDRKLCLTPAHLFLDEIFDSIIDAKHTVDIVTLGKGSYSTKAFTKVLQNSIKVLAQKSAQNQDLILVRFLQGSFLPFTSFISVYFLENLIKDIDPNNKLIIGIGETRSCLLSFNCGNFNNEHDIALNFSWNHAKIINVDNTVLITGGQNFYGEDYLDENPVNDSSVKILGPVTVGATHYANLIWKYMRNDPTILTNYCYTYAYKKIVNKCVGDLNPARPITWPSKFNKNIEVYSKVNAMYVSKLNNSIGLGDDADQSELARVYALKNAHKSIKISQQALFLKPFSFPNFGEKYLHPLMTSDGNIISALAYAMYYNHVQVYIVTSNLENTGYTSFADLDYLYDCLYSTLKVQFHLSSNEAKEELLHHLNLGTLGYLHQGTIMKKVRSHNKFWMVDDSVFYMGSHNIYPSSTQEFGVIIESKDAVQEELLKDFWDPMWEHSYKYNLR